MIDSSDFRKKRMPLNNGSGDLPALGFGTLIPDAATTISATRGALEAGFRHFDCAERYRNERQVGEALREGLAARTSARARENFNVSALPEEAIDQINRIQTRQRFNEVVKTGSPGFVPQGR